MSDRVRSYGLYPSWARLVMTLVVSAYIALGSTAWSATTGPTTATAPSLSTLDIIVEVPNKQARIYVDDEHVGENAVSHVVPYGRHLLRIECEGFKPYVQQIEASQRIHKFTIEAAKLAPITGYDGETRQFEVQGEVGSLLVMSQPPGLQATLGTVKNKTSCLFSNVPVGTTTLVVDEAKTTVSVYPGALVTVEYFSPNGRFVVKYPPEVQERLIAEFTARFGQSLDIAATERLVELWTDLERIKADEEVLRSLAADVLAAGKQRLSSDDLTAGIGVCEFGLGHLQEHWEESAVLELGSTCIEAVGRQLNADDGFNLGLQAATRFPEMFSMDAAGPLRMELRSALASKAFELLEARPPSIEAALSIHSVLVEQYNPLVSDDQERLRDAAARAVAFIIDTHPERRDAGLQALRDAQPMLGSGLPYRVRESLTSQLAADFRQRDSQWIEASMAFVDVDEQTRADLTAALQKSCEEGRDLRAIRDWLDEVASAVAELRPECDYAYALAVRRVRGDLEALSFFDSVAGKHRGTEVARLAAEEAAKITFWRDFSYANVFLAVCAVAALLFAAYYYLGSTTTRTDRIQSLRASSRQAAAKYWAWLKVSCVPTSLVKAGEQCPLSEAHSFTLVNVCVWAVARGLIGARAFAVDVFLATFLAAVYLAIVWLLVHTLCRLRPDIIQLERGKLVAASSVLLLVFWVPIVGWILLVVWWVAAVYSVSPALRKLLSEWSSQTAEETGNGAMVASAESGESAAPPHVDAAATSEQKRDET